jgi:hypothetical protein
MDYANSTDKKDEKRSVPKVLMHAAIEVRDALS